MRRNIKTETLIDREFELLKIYLHKWAYLEVNYSWKKFARKVVDFIEEFPSEHFNEAIKEKDSLEYTHNRTII